MSGLEEIEFTRKEQRGIERLTQVWHEWAHETCCAIEGGERWASEYGIEAEYDAFVTSADDLRRNRHARELMSVIADRSNLTLDPELPSFYLMRILSSGLPSTLASFHETIAARPSGESRVAEALTLERLLRDDTNRLRYMIQRAIQYTGDGQTERVLSSSSAMIQDAVWVDRAKSQTPADPQAKIADTEIHAVLNATWESTSTALERHLSARINVKLTRLTAELIFLLGILAVGYHSWRKAQQNERELIAARKGLELANATLEQERDRLEDRVLERTAALEVVSDEAQRATAAKSQFLATMSHELRTPLHSIVSYAELLKEGAEDDGRTTDVEDIDVILRASSHLLHLISQVLDLSKVEAGKMIVSAETFDLGLAVAEITRTMRPVVQKNGNTFKVAARGLLGEVCTDKGKFNQCLLNLLSNAAKFTQNGEVTLNVAVISQSGSPWLEVLVADTGIGMSEEAIAKLFQPFTQAEEDTARRFGGTGLGMSISKKFVEMLGGNLTATSVEGKGTTFRMCIPARLHASDDASSVDQEVGAATAEVAISNAA